MENRRRSNIVAIAGTFDRLHKGHQYFIKQAFSYGNRIIIGLTSDKFVKAKISNFKFPASPTGRQISNKIQISNYQTRKEELEDLLRKEQLLDRVEIVEINDVYGPAIDFRNNIESLVVTKDSKDGGEKVNQKRIQLGLKPLKLIVVPLVNADDNKRIASTRIRLGEIDRWGHLYKLKVKSVTASAGSRSDGGKKLKVEGKIRLELKKPQGVLIKGDINNLDKIVPELQSLIRRLQPIMISTIGDEVTKLCNNAGMMPELAIFDYKVNRIKKYSDLEDLGFTNIQEIDNNLKRVRNPAGFITIKLVNYIDRAIKSICQTGEQQVIEVIGEDDLAGVPAILLSPLGSVVIYGQPGEGIVVVEVTEEKKKKMVKLLNC